VNSTCCLIFFDRRADGGMEAQTIARPKNRKQKTRGWPDVSRRKRFFSIMR
jgi:hypothetical protein